MGDERKRHVLFNKTASTRDALLDIAKLMGGEVFEGVMILFEQMYHSHVVFWPDSVETSTDR